jgi:Domain of unknown function (DUF1844)
MSEKKQDFVVSDRRRFGAEGEPRAGMPVDEEEKSSTPAPAPPKPAVPQAAVPQASQPASPQAPFPQAVPREAEEEMPEPPTAEEQHEQHQAYQASGKKLDEIFQTRLGAQGGYPEMNFEKVVESLYMSALIQMGALRAEGEEPRVDIIGARQTVDSLTVLQEKTKGYLTDKEQTMLQNVLFELRMAWIELTNAIAKRATEQPVNPTQEKK